MFRENIFSFKIFKNLIVKICIYALRVRTTVCNERVYTFVVHKYNVRCIPLFLKKNNFYFLNISGNNWISCTFYSTLFYILHTCVCKRDFFKLYAKNPEIRVRLWKLYTTDDCVLFKSKQWILQNLFILIPCNFVIYILRIHTLAHSCYLTRSRRGGHDHEWDMAANSNWLCKTCVSIIFPNITIIDVLAIEPTYFQQTQGIFCLPPETNHASYLCVGVLSHLGWSHT